MKTAEVAIEHVLAGLLVISAFLLPFVSELPVVLEPELDTKDVVGVLGLAYMIGVVFDRVADTLLSPRERYLRLEVAAKHASKSAGDPFPQRELEYELREKNDGRLEWMDSLRSRIRTARELGVWGQPAALGLVVYAVSRADAQPYSPALLFGWGVVLLNVGLIVYGLWTVEGSGKDYRTDTYFKRSDVLLAKTVLADAEQWKRRKSIPLWALQIGSLSGAVVVGALACDIVLIGVGFASAFFVYMAMASRARITRTYLTFVMNAD
ncbi:MAG: hypothetical protein GY944_27950 [bacterium]|nr:hypothetical protein [bacterium]